MNIFILLKDGRSNLTCHFVGESPITESNLLNCYACIFLFNTNFEYKK